MRRIAFRADAGVNIGTGHVMRCLTLADRLAAGGHEIHFLCRTQPGQMADAIASRGHGVTLLPAGQRPFEEEDYCSWLGVDWCEDAAQCQLEIAQGVDWLVVDHYALDAGWESVMRTVARRIMVIDDLANRPHDCDLLLDQTHGRNRTDYSELVPARTRILCGCEYALLRPEFAARREEALVRRQSDDMLRLLVCMGGVDKDNATGAVLTALAAADLPDGCQITVVMGRDAPWITHVRRLAAAMPVMTEVLCDVADMAALMAASDLAIGGAGGSGLERFCVGLPSISVALAENQRPAAKALDYAGATISLLAPGEIITRLPGIIGHMTTNPEARHAIAAKAALLCDGRGGERVFEAMCGFGDD